MKYLKALVMMQLKDKIDFSFTKNRHKLISKIVFTILKFLIVTAVAYGFFYASSLLKIFGLNSGIPYEVMIVIYGIIFTLSLFSCTLGLMKNLYFAEDNKVLITLPVNGNTIFLSKLVIYYISELKRSYFLTVPIFIAFGIFSKLSVAFYFWLLLSFVILSLVPVVIGALLSIPFMYIFRFLRRVPGIFVLFYTLIVAGIVYLSVKLIGIIPANIDLTQQLGDIQNIMYKIMGWGDDFFYPVNKFVKMLLGAFDGTYNLLHYKVWIYFGITLLGIALVGGGAFLLARPLFFKMMSKSFEFEKKLVITNKPNKKRGKVRTFFVTELKDFVRSGLVSNFFSVYIAVPVLIYLINTIFCAIDTRTAGQIMVYAFNILLIMLPMLASNALVATMYSRGGRAAYVTKTMPLNPVLPLTVKILPLLIFSAISIVCSVLGFAVLAGVETNCMILLMVACIGFQWGHMFWSATSDLMNPQNEQYATTGVMNDNPNEQKMTISAFIMATVMALFSYLVFADHLDTILPASIKLCVSGLVFMAICIYMFVTKINVYYSEK